MMRLWQQSMIYLARNETVKNFMQSRAVMSDLAMRFVGGKDVNAVTEESRALKLQGAKTSLYYLGEYVEDADVIKETVSALKSTAEHLGDSNLDMFICVDPTQIGCQADKALCQSYAADIAQQIKHLTNGANGSSAHFLMLDMEDSSVVETTLNLYEALKNESLPVAITLQAYLYRTARDLEKIIANGGAVRLVKGAFAEGKEIALTRRADIDESFLKMAQMMLSEEARQNGFYPIFATHDDQLIDQITEIARSQSWPKDAYEFELLYGVRENLQQRLIANGEQVRLYLPFGEDWWPYAVRRVGESAKNVRFLVRSLLGV